MKKEIAGLNGLRAVAVLLVFLQHKTDLGGFGFGQFGVWIFFTISGFLITGILFNQRLRLEAGRGSMIRELVTFWWRRAIRIFPAYYVALFILLLAYLLGFHRMQTLAEFPFHFAYLSNYWIGYIAKDWIGNASVFWSLSVEQQFYFCFGPLLLLISAHRHYLICCSISLCGAIGLCVLLYFSVAPIVIYTGVVLNFGLLAAGGAWYHWLRKKQLTEKFFLDGKAALSLVVVVAIVACSTVELLQKFESAIGYFTSKFLFALASFFVVGWVIRNEGSLIVRILELKWISRFGMMSYGFYIVHNFVPNFESSKYLLMILGSPRLVSIAGVMLSFVLSYALAVCSWRFVEFPALQYKEIFQSRSVS